MNPIRSDPVQQIYILFHVGSDQIADYSHLFIKFVCRSSMELLLTVIVNLLLFNINIIVYANSSITYTIPAYYNKFNQRDFNIFTYPLKKVSDADRLQDLLCYNFASHTIQSVLLFILKLACMLLIELKQSSQQVQQSREFCVVITSDTMTSGVRPRQGKTSSMVASGVSGLRVFGPPNCVFLASGFSCCHKYHRRSTWAWWRKKTGSVRWLVSAGQCARSSLSKFIQLCDAITYHLEMQQATCRRRWLNGLRHAGRLLAHSENQDNYQEH